MSAFTHLCEKVNISLAHSTMTIYSKNNSSLYLPYGTFISHGVPFVSGHRDEVEHDSFHDDTFDQDKTHYHLKFSVKMTEEKLSDILSVLIDLNFINQTEKNSFLLTYKTINDAALERFHTRLTQLQVKATQLTTKAKTNPERYGAAADAANKLYNTLKSEADEYLNDKSLETYERFNANCNKAIEDARPILEKHRGYANLLCNLAAAVLGLGVIYLIAATVNYYKTEGKHFFFEFNPPRTDSIQKLEQFQEAQSGLLRT